jgi:hypothetical protein
LSLIESSFAKVIARVANKKRNKPRKAVARSIFVSGVSAAASCWRQRLFNESLVLVASGSPAYDHHAIAISDIL